jgi:DNA-binding transcriptional regulator YdaS (Cro superfamily)
MKSAVEELRKWRDRLPKGFNTLAQAGALLGISAPQMYRYENGLRRFPANRVQAVSAITGIPPEILRPDVFGKPKISRLAMEQEQDNGQH